MPKSVRYHAYLIESLKDPKEASAYFKAVLEEKDVELLQKAINNLIEAGYNKMSDFRGSELPEELEFNKLYESTIQPIKQEKELEFNKLYEYTIQRIKQETDLINNRLSWMLTFQGFLFAAIALVSKKDTDQAVSLILKTMIPVIGIVVALLATTGITAAYISIWEVRSSSKKGLKANEQYPPAYGNNWARNLGMVTSYGIPLLFVITWVILRTEL